MKKIYLAHAIETRKEVREQELIFERDTGIALLNPFYDTQRSDIVEIDAGKKTRWNEELDFEGIVTNDIEHIEQCDALVAVISKPSFGTAFEIWECLYQMKPVYIISESFGMHPWIRYVIKESGGKVFNDWEEFTEYWK